MIIGNIPLRLSGVILTVLLVVSVVAWYRIGRFAWRSDGRVWALIGLLPLVYLACERLPWTAMPVISFTGPDHVAARRRPPNSEVSGGWILDRDNHQFDSQPVALFRLILAATPSLKAVAAGCDEAGGLGAGGGL